MTKELKNDVEKMYEQRRIYQQALAIIKRGREAGIPDRYLRINEEEFSDLLVEKFHKKPKEWARLAYTEAQKRLFKRPFIIIDGGDIESRKKAAFAILFRMIACDRRGLYKGCQELIHKFQTIYKESDGMHRNQLSEDLKIYDILLIAEFGRSMFSAHFESGSFFDEVLGFRSDHMKPTILTFSDVISKDNPIRHKDCGEYFANFSIKELTTDEVLRVRVKITDIESKPKVNNKDIEDLELSL